MQQSSKELTKDNLISFLDFAADKGLLKKTTAGVYKSACNTILGILDETEAADLSKIDLDGVILRHRNLAASKIPPKTIKTYETRTRNAVRDFIEYCKDPSSWKPPGQTRASTTSAVKKTKNVTHVTKAKEIEEPGRTDIQPSVHIDFQIHIPPEATSEQIDYIFSSMRRHLYGDTISK